MIRLLCLNPTIDRMYYISSFVAGTQYHGNCPETYPSGKGINVARILRAFSVKATVYAFVGGSNGKRIEDEVIRLGHEGVFFRHEGETRETINIIDREKEQETEITESGVVISSSQQQAFLEKLEADLRERDLVICSGLPANGMDVDIYHKVSLLCERRGASCVVDANRQFLQNSFPGKYLFAKPNRNELQKLFGVQTELDDDEIIDYAKRLVGSGVENVLVTLGGDGAIFVNKDSVYRLRIPEVKVVSTIGSGDSAVTGFCYGYMTGLDIEGCLKLAMAFGVVNAMHPEVGFVVKDEVEAMVGRIKVKKLA